MPELRLPGCRPRPLLGYLKSLGLIRIVARQADQGTRARWHADALQIACDLDLDGLTSFLLHRYAPSPVVSPWNGGSGFYPNDETAAVNAIENSGEARLAPFRDAIAAARAALEHVGIAPKIREFAEQFTDKELTKQVKRIRDETKLPLLRELRATLPDDALEWLDAAIVLLGSDIAYPPLLGSGGNDGRFDIANNYAHAVVSALALADGDLDRAQALLLASLEGSQAPLERKLSMGHLYRDSSPVNSPVGKADALGNPWDLVLAVEGSLLLAAGAARRHGAALEPALVAPFTVRPTAAGYGSAVSGEDGRAELWLPLWSGWTTLRELESLVREARAQVGRRRYARSGLDFARAAGRLGVARGIDAFERYAVLRRAGQSGLAVPAGRVQVRPRPSAEAMDTLAPWLNSLLRFAARECPRAAEIAIRRLENAAFRFADRAAPADGCPALEVLGEVESALALSGRTADKAELRPPRRIAAGAWLSAADDGTPEFAVAASLASLRDRKPSLPTLRDYVHGTVVDEQGRREYPLESDVAVERRADWRRRLAAIHVRRHLDAEAAGRGSDPAAGDGLAFDLGLECPLGPARALAAVLIDGQRVMRLVAGLSILDFAQVERSYLLRGAQTRPDAPPYPLFDALALAWAGTARTPLRPRPGWAARLRTGNVQAVASDALLRLRMAGLVPLVTAEELLSERHDGPALGAALLLHLDGRARAYLARELTETLEAEEAGSARAEEKQAPIQEGATT